MSNFSHFNNNNNNNNNNYIPSFYGDMASLSRPQLIENASHVRSFGAPHNFTFTYPTQGTTIPTPRSSIQATSSMGFLGAPGLGTTWQHSNPCLTSPVFTGMPARSEPQPSCSSPMKRPKRKAVEYAEDAPSSKVYLCTDQFANLHINHDWTQYPNNRQQLSQGGSDEIRGHDPGGWNRFRKVENSIDCDGEEERAEKKEKGVLHINDSFIDTAKSSTPESILPRDVLSQISQPCMQVVLWKSPGELVRDLVRDDSPLSLRSPSPSTPPIVTQSLSSSPTSSPSRLPTSFRESSKFDSRPIDCGSSSGSFFNTSSQQQSPPNTYCNPSTSSFQHSSSSNLVPPSSSSPQNRWNWSSLTPSNSRSSPDFVDWDDNLNLDPIDCDEEMQL